MSTGKNGSSETNADVGRPTLLPAVAPSDVVAALQAAGFRAELADDAKRPRVRSAVQGLVFSIEFVSQPNEQQQYLDFSFHASIRIEGALPDSVLNRWNHAKRFVRLVRNERFLHVTMDVLVAGGVSAQHLRAQCELWDHLIRELVLHLRQPAVAEEA
ncbi:YbjN domain-containing protein [Solimonas flava]|uniref:YbjN domain-containing protein n=1 Tax=Solimonas flava TaxID=415849 RepID=UPI0003F95977|nr:YbjN domain-containing protein [Solimonas flava]